MNSTKYFLPNDLLLRLYHFAGLTTKDVENTRNQVGNNTNELLLLLTARQMNMPTTSGSYLGKFKTLIQ